MTVDPNESDSFDDIVRALDHDLRNPVVEYSRLSSTCCATHPGTTFSGEQLEFLGRIEDNCRTLLDMLRRLRDIAIEQRGRRVARRGSSGRTACRLSGLGVVRSRLPPTAGVP